MVEKVIRAGICNAIYQYENDRCMKNCDKNKEYLKYWALTKLCVWAMS